MIIAIQRIHLQPEPYDLDLSRLRNDPKPIYIGEIEGPEGQRASLAYVVRTPFAVIPGVEPIHLDRADVTPPLAEAVDELAMGIWGEDWSRALADIAGLNHRTTARDRVRKFGLPPRVIRALVLLAQREDARELALVLRAVGKYLTVHQVKQASSITIDLMELVYEFRGSDPV